jgi:hypothetical protein
MDQSDNLAPPFLGLNQHPLYPALSQLVRVTGPGSVVFPVTYYPCQVEQCPGTPPLRDREQAYVFEANSLPLVSQGVYDCRLVGSWQGLPLYATACCPVASSSSLAGH